MFKLGYQVVVCLDILGSFEECEFCKTRWVERVEIGHRAAKRWATESLGYWLFPGCRGLFQADLR